MTGFIANQFGKLLMLTTYKPLPLNKQEEFFAPGRNGHKSVFRHFPGRDAVPTSRDPVRRSAPTVGVWTFSSRAAGNPKGIAIIQPGVASCRAAAQRRRGNELPWDLVYNDFAWQSGYRVFSIGFSQIETVRKYVAGQEEHHRKVSFQDEFRELLRRYELEFDERYVWD